MVPPRRGEGAPPYRCFVGLQHIIKCSVRNGLDRSLQIVFQLVPISIKPTSKRRRNVPTHWRISQFRSTRHWPRISRMHWKKKSVRNSPDWKLSSEWSKNKYKVIKNSQMNVRNPKILNPSGCFLHVENYLKSYPHRHFFCVSVIHICLSYVEISRFCQMYSFFHCCCIF